MSTKTSEPKGAKDNVKESKKTKANVSGSKTKGKKAKVKKVKKEAIKDEVNHNNTKNSPKLRYWLIDNKITQKDLANKTHLSVNTVYRLNHFGNGTKSIVLLVALVLQHKFGYKDMTEEKLTELLKP